MYLLRIITLPFVPIYYLITKFRNRLYDLGIKKSTSFNLPIICVGNLSVGGTGKTPMIEYLIRLLSTNYKVATLSRGYKRKTKGFLVANRNSNVQMLGDEPYQFYNKFGENVFVAVDEDRVHGLNQLLTQIEKPEIVLLDDAFQHRKIKAGLNILLTTYCNLYVNDYVLPTGNLREPRTGADRADLIVVTKCPKDLGNDEKIQIVKRINPKESQHVFFSHIKYADVVKSLGNDLPLAEINNFTLVTAIANAKPLVEFLKSRSLNFEHLNYKDHHGFTDEEVKMLKEKQLILTTEKDFVKLKQFNYLLGKLYYLPIEMELEYNAEFNKQILNFIQRYRQI